MSHTPYRNMSELCRWALMLRHGRTSCTHGELNFFGHFHFKSASKPLNGSHTLLRIYAPCLSLQLGGVLVEQANALYLDPLRAGLYSDKGTSQSAQLKAVQLHLALIQQLGEPVYTHASHQRCLAILPCEPAHREPQRCAQIQSQIATALSLALRRAPGHPDRSRATRNEAWTPYEDGGLAQIA